MGREETIYALGVYKRLVARLEVPTGFGLVADHVLEIQAQEAEKGRGRYPDFVAAAKDLLGYEFPDWNTACYALSHVRALSAVKKKMEHDNLRLPDERKFRYNPNMLNHSAEIAVWSAIMDATTLQRPFGQMTGIEVDQIRWQVEALVSLPVNQVNIERLAAMRRGL